LAFRGNRGKVRKHGCNAEKVNKTNNLFRWISPSNAVILVSGASNFIGAAAAAVVGQFSAYFLRVGENVR
jgi:hypothetical protein